MNTEKEKAINSNKKAYFNYQILEKIECGIQLKGTEIKSLRTQGCNLTESYVKIQNNEAFICQMEIPLYKYGNIENHDPFRKRKLLLHKKEINHINNDMDRQTLSCVPLKIYLKRGLAKVLIGLGKSKKLHDKRDSIKKREANKDINRAMKYHNR